MNLYLLVGFLLAGGLITWLGYTPFMIASSVIVAVGTGLILILKANMSQI